MSNNLMIPANIQVPAHLQSRLGAPSSIGDAMSGGIGGGASFPRISLKGSRFRINEGGTETVLPDLNLNVVIVGANPGLSKTWYEAAWTADAEPVSPDCQSFNGVTPDPESAKPQSDRCASCVQNQWGSKITPNGQKIKACADQKRLAVVAAEDPSGPVYLLQVTPAALKGLNQYHKELSLRGIPAEIVCTKLSFDTSASFPKLMFQFGGFLSPETQAVVDNLFGSDSVMEVTGQSNSEAAPPPPLQIAKPLLVAVPPPPPPPPPPAPVMEVLPPEQPRRGFGAAASPPAPPAEVSQPRTTGFKQAAEPAAVATSSSNDLLDSISALIGDMADDDA